MRAFWILAKMASMQRLYTLQNHDFGSKNKAAKNISIMNLQTQHSFSMQKTAVKNN